MVDPEIWRAVGWGEGGGGGGRGRGGVDPRCAHCKQTKSCVARVQLCSCAVCILKSLFLMNVQYFSFYGVCLQTSSLRGVNV